MNTNICANTTSVGKHLFQIVALRDIIININRWTFSVKFVVGNFLSGWSWLLVRQSTQRKKSSHASTQDVMGNTKQKLSIGDIRKLTGLRVKSTNVQFVIKFLQRKNTLESTSKLTQMSCHFTVKFVGRDSSGGVGRKITC